MLVSWNWLKEFITLPSNISLDEVTEKLTMTGCEVEGMEMPCDSLQGIVTAKVVELKKHPSKDGLYIVTLDAGGNNRAICVTAAENLNIGDMVPYAAPGAVITGGVTLLSKSFDGITSEGMMLSADEIGLPDVADEFGILRLPVETKPGLDFKSTFGLDDVILDVSITANRGDLLSIMGLAREIHALFPESELKDIDIKDIDGNATGCPVDFKGVTIEDPDCLAFSLGYASDIKIAPSPLKARIMLSMMGMRPISNVVDISNLTMLLMGQPSHTYDLDMLPEKEITVRLAKDGEKITTLDGKRRSLTNDDLIITSAGKPVGIAGVMGGENTEISEATRTVALECASFAASRVSRTSRKLGIMSEAAYRYSRYVDPLKVIPSLKYALNLFVKWKCAGKVYGNFTLVESEHPSNVEVPLRAGTLKRILLWDDMEEAAGILSRLGVEKTREEDGTWFFSVPTSRPDITIEEDLVEEVGRIRGYDHVKPRIPGSLSEQGTLDEVSEAQGALRNVLLARGYTEIVTYSFISPNFRKTLMLPDDDIRAYPVALSNPLSPEMSSMRTTMLPGMISALGLSLRTGWKRPIRVFELGRVFLRTQLESADILEQERIGGLVYAGADSRSPYGDSDVDDFFSVKADIMSLASVRGVSLEFVQGNEPFGHAGQKADVLYDGKKIGFLARLKPAIEQSLGVNSPLYVFELDLDALINKKRAVFMDVPPYPAVYRDISLLVDKSTSSINIIKEIKSIAGNLLWDVSLFDVYEGENVPSGKRSLAFSLAYRSDDKTLKDAEVEKVHGHVREKLEKLGYALR